MYEFLKEIQELRTTYQNEIENDLVEPSDHDSIDRRKIKIAVLDVLYDSILNNTEQSPKQKVEDAINTAIKSHTFGEELSAKREQALRSTIREGTFSHRMASLLDKIATFQATPATKTVTANNANDSQDTPAVCNIL
jgi:hypothetical protein